MPRIHPSIEDYHGIQEALDRFPEMDCFDLGDFDEGRLGLNGELEVSSFDSDILLDVRATVLSVSRFAIGEASGSNMRINSPNYAYVVRNLAKPPHAAVLFDDQLVDSGLRVSGYTMDGTPYNDVKCFGGQSIVIGTRTTPELELDDAVDDEHLLVRMGAVQGNIHFADLYSTLGTVAYIPKDAQVGYPWNEWYVSGGRTLTRSAVEGEWVERRRPTAVQE